MTYGEVAVKLVVELQLAALRARIFAVITRFLYCDMNAICVVVLSETNGQYTRGDVADCVRNMVAKGYLISRGSHYYTPAE